MKKLFVLLAAIILIVAFYFTAIAKTPPAGGYSDYIVVGAKDTDTFTKRVNYKLKEGYELIGGVGFGKELLFQAMAKK